MEKHRLRSQFTGGVEMTYRIIRAAIALFIVCVLSLSLIPIGTASPKAAEKLTAEEIAFAEAVGVGEYAYDIDWTYAYEYGEFEFPSGSGLEAWRGAGSEPAHEYAEYLANEMTAIGLQDVSKEPFPVHAYNYGGASVQILEPEAGPVWLAAGHAGLPGTPPEGITAEVEYVGLGTRFDYEQAGDVTGKLVLIDVSEEEMYWLQYPLYEAELHGAIGAVVHWIEYQDVEDSVVTHDSESRTAIPAVCISHENAEILKTLIVGSDAPVQVKVWCDASIDYDGTAYNVYGYIRGTTNPDEYIIVGDHYDKWWYGASDNGAGVARLMGIAKALIDSGYRPSRTIVFIATDAEEFGWTDTEFDWALGAWWAIFVQHPDWAGKTRGFFLLEGGGDSGATSVYASGTPETELFRKSLLRLFNEWFSSRTPWSSYYHPAVEWTEKFSSTWADGFSFNAAGIPVLDVGCWQSTEYSGYSYHTQNDTMEWISADGLAMSIISNGIAVIELDRALFTPYSFQKRADNLGMYLDQDLLREAGADTSGLYEALDEFKKVGDEVWSLIKATKSLDNADEVNAILMRTEDKILSDLTKVGGYIEEMYPHQHYLDDSWYLREGIESLEDGNIDRALMWLSWVYGMYTGRWVSYENYEYMQLHRWNEDNFNQFWGRGRTAMIIDIWHEYDSLWTKKSAGLDDYSEEIGALWEKYDVVVDNLQASLDYTTQSLIDSTTMLEQARNLLM